jgi:D-beta-D-heptose 7-phosphate kinase/D-beta-D-heptose 1-phosphate adenosyltransferase
MTNFSQFIETFSTLRILCVGDVMLDQFVRGTISRISPEAPVPVLHIKEETAVLGGAGNVVRNLEALGCNVTFISVIGQDSNGSQIQKLLKEFQKVTPHLLIDTSRTTTTKTRFIAGNQQVLRTDFEQNKSLNKNLETDLIHLFKSNIKSHDLVILSDYAKGIFSPEGLQTLIQEARDHNKPILVDPKGNDFSKYKGATLLTPNRQELAEATLSKIQNEEDLVSVTQSILEDANIEAMIVTRGPEGMTLVTTKGEIEHLPTQALEVFDVSGAGDTVIATLAASFASGASLSTAMQLANVAAGLVVAKVGTAVVHPDELLSALQLQSVSAHEQKIVSWQKAQDLIHKWKRRGQKIVFTNGCFDLLHPGHVSLLNQAKKAGDRLIVGLNSDASVKRLKGPTRPIQEETARAFVLSSLECVDLVVLFEEDTPIELIKMVKPDVHVKGGDYTVDQLIEAPIIQSYGGEILLIDLVEGQSTTGMVQRMTS